MREEHLQEVTERTEKSLSRFPLFTPVGKVLNRRNSLISSISEGKSVLRTERDIYVASRHAVLRASIKAGCIRMMKQPEGCAPAGCNSLISRIFERFF